MAVLDSLCPPRPPLQALGGEPWLEALRAEHGWRRARDGGSAEALLAAPEDAGEAGAGAAGAAREAVAAALQAFHGVGRKVADCVAVFALDQPGALPVDTHVWAIACRLDASLKDCKSLTPAVHARVGGLFRARYGAAAGWAHCLLFAAELPAFAALLPPEIAREQASRGVVGCCAPPTFPSPIHRPPLLLLLLLFVQAELRAEARATKDAAKVAKAARKEAAGGGEAAAGAPEEKEGACPATTTAAAAVTVPCVTVAVSQLKRQRPVAAATAPPPSLERGRGSGPPSGEGPPDPSVPPVTSKARAGPAAAAARRGRAPSSSSSTAAAAARHAAAS